MISISKLDDMNKLNTETGKRLVVKRLIRWFRRWINTTPHESDFFFVHIREDVQPTLDFIKKIVDKSTSK
jgi:hypothetical protein